MNRWLLSVALFGLAVSGAQGQGGPGPVPLPKDFVAQASAYVDRWAKSGRFTGAVLIAIEGKPVLRKAYGYADWSTRRPMTPETPVPLFSISKSFTAGAVLLLQERGLLSVQDRASKYVTDLPEAMKDATIHQLLTHTSGASLKDQNAWYTTHFGRSLTKGPIEEPSSMRTPGVTWEYSNVGYMILAAAVEKVSGRPFDRFLKEAIFEPLHMTGAGVGGYWEGQKEVARGHHLYGGRLVPFDQFLSIIPGAGGVHANVDDLLKWRAAIEGGTLFSEASRKALLTPYAAVDGESRYGYGWFYRTEWPMWEHTGGGAACSTSVAWLPERKMTIVVLKNSDGSAGPLFSMELAKIAYDLTPIAPKFAEVDSMDSYQGIYLNEKGAQTTVTVNDGWLNLALPGRLGMPFEYAGGRKFQATGQVAAFEPTPDGLYNLRLTLNGKTVQRLKHVPLPVRLDDYLGVYGETGNNEEIGRVGRWLVVKSHDRSVSNDPFLMVLFPSGKDRFVLPALDAELRFMRDGRGRVKAVRTMVEGKVRATSKKLPEKR